MFERKNRRRVAAVRHFGIAVVLLLGAGSVQALDDPMRPPGLAASHGSPVAAPVRQHLALSSTLIAPDRRIAVINGRRLSVGQRIGDARVLEILPSQVRLRRGGHTITLHLLPLQVKKSVKHKQRRNP